MWSNNIPFHIYTTSALSIPHFHGYFGCFLLLAVVNMLQSTYGYRYLFEIMVLFSLDIYLEMGLLDHMVVIFLIFKETTLFSTVAASIYTSTHSAQGSLFSISFSTLVSCVFHDSYSDKCEVLSHFYFHLLDD